MSDLPPCAIFEDDHLLVVNKPPGWNTHSPSPYAGEGIYEWLKQREPRWSNLAIIHRLDKETSGILVFSKTTEANKSLTQQFEAGEVKKEYIFETDGKAPQKKLVVESNLQRAGDRYVSVRSGGVRAVTEFEALDERSVLARPRTGRTHQIRVHASENGFPIVGDSLYGENASSGRLRLHSRKIQLRHPATGQPIEFTCDPRAVPGWIDLRAFLNTDQTNAFRWFNNEDKSNWLVDQFGGHLLFQSPRALTRDEHQRFSMIKGNGAYFKVTAPTVRGKEPQNVSPQHFCGESVSGPLTILENDVRYEVNFSEGYSVGIFLDQRDNRRRLLKSHVAADFPIEVKGAEVLNTFAYTCAFSVCAALAGARVTSLDLSKKYLDWGRRNFTLNKLNPDEHDFIYGDVFDWIKRLAKKGRAYDIVLLDPPTFSQSKQSGIFRAESGYGKLVSEALLVLKPNGVLFCSTNAARLEPEKFMATIRARVAAAKRTIVREHYFPQPPDFPISKAEPAYLKTAWFRIT